MVFSVQEHSKIVDVPRISRVFPLFLLLSIWKNAMTNGNLRVYHPNATLPPHPQFYHSMPWSVIPTIKASRDPRIWGPSFLGLLTLWDPFQNGRLSMAFFSMGCDPNGPYPLPGSSSSKWEILHEFLVGSFLGRQNKSSLRFRENTPPVTDRWTCGGEMRQCLLRYGLALVSLGITQTGPTELFEDFFLNLWMRVRFRTMHIQNISKRIFHSFF